MFQHMRDAAGSAGKMKIEKRTEQSPTQAGPVGNGDIDFAYGRDTLADEVKGFAPQRGLQAVGHVSLGFPAAMDGFLAKGCIKSHGLLNCCSRGRSSADDFDQGNQVRRVEWMADQHALGMAGRRMLDFA